jgi:hypothetical protein
MKYILLLAVVYGLLVSPCLAMEDEYDSPQSRGQVPANLVADKDDPNLNKDEWSLFAKTLLGKITELADRCEIIADQLESKIKLSPEQLKMLQKEAYILKKRVQIIELESNIATAYVESVEETLRKQEIMEEARREQEIIGVLSGLLPTSMDVD